MARAFVIHGFQGRAEGSWRPWLKAELEARKWSVQVPQMPNTNHPKPSEWVHELESLVGKAGPDCFFVGHSLGCVTILQYLEALPKGTTVGGAVLIAGPISKPKFSVLNPFFAKPSDWAKIKEHCPKTIAIYSDNDPLVPVSDGLILEEKLGAKLIVEEGAGHFRGDDGFLTLPVALNSLLALAGKGGTK